jgi:ketosteroid isomerase-like protein
VNAFRTLLPLFILTACLLTTDAMADASTAPDSVAIAAAAAAFHAALAAGDSTGALALLSEDVVVLEGGELETRAQYAGHHLAADIAFTRAAVGERAVTGVRQEGDAAWLWAVSSCRGSWEGREVDSVGAELMVLARGKNGWRIRAIHWSSRRR